VAPVLTLFVGGNHEASQPLQELYYGGWVAPKIYYLGAAGVVNVAGVRIGGISGIYKDHDYNLGRFERPPFDNKALRSIYHTRSSDVFRMKCLSPSTRIDIMLSHDWPEGVERYGNTDDLLRRKPFFRNEVEQRCLGSPPNRELLETLQPKWWFAAHLHVKFSAIVDHSATMSPVSTSTGFQSLIPSQAIKLMTSKASPKNDAEESISTETDAANVKLETTDSGAVTHFQTLESSDQCQGPDLAKMMTQFLSLDKCLPRRHCLCVVHVPVEQRQTEIDLEYDLEWLSLLRKTHTLSIAEKKQVQLPSDLMHVSPEDINETKRLLQCSNNGNFLKVPNSFTKTVPPHDDAVFRGQNLPHPFPLMGNPQTDEFLSLLALEHIVTVPFGGGNKPSSVDAGGNNSCTYDENEIEIDSGDEAAGAADMAEVVDEDQFLSFDDVSESVLPSFEATTSKKPRLEDE
jgi:lariat debranching enzyme